MFSYIKRIWNRASGVTNPQQWLIDWVRQVESDSGINVTPDVILTFPAVWYALNKICGHVGQLPIHQFRRLERGAEVDLMAAGDYVLNVEPNEYQTPIQFKEQLQCQSVLWGNGRSLIVRTLGQVERLLPINPWDARVEMVQGGKFHVVRVNEDSPLYGYTRRYVAEGDAVMIPDIDVFHIPGLGFDGLQGKSLLDVMKNSVGLGLAAEKSANKHFSSGAKPSLLLSAPTGMFRDEKDAKKFIDFFNRFHSGLDNAGKVGMLREGMTAQTLSMSANDNQHVEQRRFQRQEAALFFLLEQILGDDSSVSYNSLEQKNMAYLTNCLMRWLVKWEQECNRKLLTSRQKLERAAYFKFNTGALLRADIKTTYESLSIGITSRILSPNEAREKLDMNPYDGGDEYENPAISPGSPGSTEDPAEPETEDEPQDANRRAVIARMTHLIGVECNRIRQAAERPDQFLDRIERFYEGWQKTLTAAVLEFGGTVADAELHCKVSHQKLLDLSGNVNADELADAVSAELSTWPERAGALVEGMELLSAAA